jgi:hypothetical protein
MTLHEHVTPAARAVAAGAWGEEKVTCAPAQGSQARHRGKPCPPAMLVQARRRQVLPFLKQALHAALPGPGACHRLPFFVRFVARCAHTSIFWFLDTPAQRIRLTAVAASPRPCTSAAATARAGQGDKPAASGTLYPQRGKGTAPPTLGATAPALPATVPLRGHFAPRWRRGRTQQSRLCSLLAPRTHALDANRHVSGGTG